MRLIRLFVFRYLFSKKRTNFINIITGISFFGVMVGTAALVVVLSVYNGLEDLTRSMYSRFNPDVRISPSAGKWLDAAALQQELRTFKGLATSAAVLEENAMLRYDRHEFIGAVKGVDSNYSTVTGIDSFIQRGRYMLWDGFGLPYAIAGSGVAYTLSISLNDYRNVLEVYVPKRGKIDLSRPDLAFRKRSLLPAGFFDVQPEINSRYTLVPLAFMQELLELDSSRASAVELKLVAGYDARKAVRQLQQQLGDGYLVQDREQQEEAIFRIFQTEKWWTYLFLLLIVLVAAMNLVGALSMLVMEKQRDIALLYSLGATPGRIRAIFLALGLLITLLGASLGVGVGAGLSALQEQYGLLEFAGSENFLVSAYPVQLRAGDVLATFGGVLLIGLLCSVYPALRAARNFSSLGGVK